MGMNNSTKSEIRIAIVGAGYMAREHARAFADIPGVRIVGVVGRDPERANALAETHQTRAFETIEAMYTETGADAVIVAVNELSMHTVCSQVFAFPWKCLLEKPVGLNLAEARTILDLAQAADMEAYVAFNRRSYSSTLSALEALAPHDGPRLISVLDQQDLQSVRDSGQPQAVIDNYMFANSIHLIDYLTLFGRGAVQEVRCIKRWTPDNPDYVIASLHFESGDVGLYQAVWNGPGPWSVTVTNDLVRAELRPLEKLSVQRRSERRLVEIPTDPVDSEFKPGLRRQAFEFCRAMRGEKPDLCDLETGFQSMLLCAEVYGLSGEADR